MIKKLDLLAFAAHPDDTELSCAATLALHVAHGKRVGVVDLTHGELGTRGTVEIRAQEAKTAAEIIGLHVRENLGLEDGFFQNNKESQLKIVEAIRKFQPEIVLANAVTDRHPDHGRAAQLVEEAVFLAGLTKVETLCEGIPQAPWRPNVVYHYIQSRWITPQFVVDVSAHWDTKMEAIRAFKSQFHNPESQEPATFISDPAFIRMIEARALDLGHSIGAKYAEGFTVSRNLGVRNLFDLV
jgi:N-acetylglucosamine malate deacetylase 1